MPTVNVRFRRLIPAFPRRNPVVFELIVTVKSHFLASAVCANFPKSVSNSSIIAGNRNGPNCNVGRTDLSGKSDSVPAPRKTAPTPAVTRSGAGPSSAMVTRSRARGDRSMSVEPEVKYRSEGEFPQEIEIPAETCEGGSGAARPTTDTASQYTTADISQDVTTSSSITQAHRTSPPHISSRPATPAYSSSALGCI